MESIKEDSVKRPTILVTGGAGYIGSHTVQLLVDEGYEVIVYDNLSKGYRQFVPSGVHFHKGDLKDVSVLEEVFRGHAIDAVVHFAADSLVSESMEKPAKYYENNVVGTMNLLNMMKTYGVGSIVFSSTAAVYGEPARVPIFEDDVKIPTNTYGDTKLAIEKMIYWYGQAYGIKHVILRYFNACGAHSNGLIGEAHDPETHLIPLVLDAAIGTREKIMIFGDDYDTHDGTCVRDYVHVMDLATAHVLALEKLGGGTGNEVYNLGTSEGLSVKEIIAAAREVTGKEIEVAVVDRRAGDPARLIADSSKIRQELGWEPVRSNAEDILSSAWKWHQQFQTLKKTLQ